MKEHNDILTIQETEQLCHLYMECHLSVLEETELHYVLGKLPYTSPLIDETRRLMGLPYAAAALNKKHKRRPWIWVTGSAAAVAITIVISTIFIPAHRDATDCIAYVNGQEITGMEADAIVKEHMAKAEAFMQTIDNITTSEQEKITYFMNHKTPSK